MIHPAKGIDSVPEVAGTQVPKSGQLHAMLKEIFDRASRECDIEIQFRPDESGRQNNATRSLLTSYVDSPTLPTGRSIAERLQSVTTRVPGLGLLFLMTGAENGQSRFVASRFPADNGIIAEETDDALSVEFIERVFMKSAKSYKSVFYESKSTKGGFWNGRAVDRQISGARQISDYWIRDFLESELRTTSAAGSRRLAVAMRDATRSAEDVPVRQELVAAAQIIAGLGGAVGSGRALVGRLGLSAEALGELELAFPRTELLDESFELDAEEFSRHLNYRMVETDQGALLIAESSSFDDVFDREVVDEEQVIERFSTVGRVTDERLRVRR